MTELSVCPVNRVQHRYNVLLLPKVHLSTVAASELKRKKKKCKVRESKQKQNWGSKWYDHVKLKQEALG